MTVGIVSDLSFYSSSRRPQPGLSLILREGHWICVPVHSIVTNIQGEEINNWHNLTDREIRELGLSGEVMTRRLHPSDFLRYPHLFPIFVRGILVESSIINNHVLGMYVGEDNRERVTQVVAGLKEANNILAGLLRPETTSSR